MLDSKSMGFRKPAAAAILLTIITFSSLAQNNTDTDYQEDRVNLASELRSQGKLIQTSVYNAFLEVPRHSFVSQKYRRLVYQDIPVPAADSSILPSASDTAECIDLLSPSSSDSILIIGNNAGYAAALLSRTCREVYLIEESSAAASYAEIFALNGYDNIRLAETQDVSAFDEILAFDKIFIHGAVSGVSEKITEKLALQGNIVFIAAQPESLQLIMSFRRSLLGDSIISGNECFFPVISKLKVVN